MLPRLLILGLAMLAAGFAPAPLPRPKPTTPEGRWLLVSDVVRGKERLRKEVLRMVVTRETLTFERDGKKTVEYRIAVDPKANPPALTMDRIVPAKTRFLCIYELNKDTLKIAYIPGKSSDTRPASWAVPGVELAIMTLRRDR